MNDLHFANVLINLFLSLMMLKFLFDYRPMDTRFLNILEITNEIFTLFFYYFMFLFSQWVPYPELRYRAGFVFMYYMIFIVSMNIVIIVYEVFVESVRMNQKVAIDKAWDEYYQLLDKMATFLVFEASEHKSGIIDLKDMEKHKKMLLKKYSYK